MGESKGGVEKLSSEDMMLAKQAGFSDKQIGLLTGNSESEVRDTRQQLKVCICNYGIVLF